ncbi:MaoC family dehydratase [Isoalcanivorax beigongshangi]|uniref:MaoC family dehydratase n=1 Tax=Isoalcanivorax beigongshangi TaxID=3238810 RepID=A0ABV4AHU5_9GAMM
MKHIAATELEQYVGQELGLSDWFAIDQARIQAFADATLDHQYIHVDPERARETPFGSTIAHGFLTLALLPHLQRTIAGFVVPRDMKMAVNYGFDSVRFLAPVKVDQRIRARATLLAAEQRRAGQWLLRLEYTVEVEHEARPALRAEWLVLYFV